MFDILKTLPFKNALCQAMLNYIIVKNEGINIIIILCSYE